jgi:hypothetical protein
VQLQIYLEAVSEGVRRNGNEVSGFGSDVWEIEISILKWACVPNGSIFVSTGIVPGWLYKILFSVQGLTAN